MYHIKTRNASIVSIRAWVLVQQGHICVKISAALQLKMTPINQVTEILWKLGGRVFTSRLESICQKFNHVLWSIPIVTINETLAQRTQVVQKEYIWRAQNLNQSKALILNLNQSKALITSKQRVWRSAHVGCKYLSKMQIPIYSSCTHKHTRARANTSTKKLPCESKTFHSAQVQAHPPNRGVCTFIHGPFFGIWQLYNYQSSTCRAFSPTTPHCARSIALERRGLWFKWLLSPPNPPEAHKSHKGSSKKAGQNSTRQKGSLKSQASLKYRWGDLLMESFWLVCIDGLWSSAMGPGGWT